VLSDNNDTIKTTVPYDVTYALYARIEEWHINWRNCKRRTIPCDSQNYIVIF